MKKPIFPILALLLALAANVRGQATPTPPPTWAQSYGFGSYDANNQPSNDNTYGSGSDRPVATAPMPDGGVVVAGRLAPNELNSGSSAGATGLVRYDSAGAIVWQQLLRQDNDTVGSNGVVIAAQNRVSQMRTDAVGNVFVSGGLGRDDGNIVAPFVAKFSPAGALLWQNSLNQIIEQDIVYGAPRDQPYSVTEYTTMDLTPDGGVVVGSQVYSGGNGHTDPIIVKFNGDGSVALHRIYANSLDQYSGVLSVCQRQDANGFAVLLSGSRGPDIVVLLTDANGNPVLQRSFNSDGTGGDATFITRSGDGGYFLLGPTTAGAEVRKLRADLTPIWQKIISRYVGGNGLTLAPTLTATPDGGCILGGQLAEASYKAGGNPVSNALLLTLDGTGTLRSAHLLGGSIGEGVSGSLSVTGAPLTSCLTTDGAVAFSIATFSYATGSTYKADWWVVKAGMDGKVAGFGGTMSDPPLDTFGQVESNETASVVTNDYGPGLTNEVSSTTTTEPRIIQEDLGNNIGINKPTVKTQTTTPIPPPVHGGLSGITFTVNESTDPVLGLADTVLRFRAVQSGRPAGLDIRVQSSTDGGSTWTDLPTATHGTMTYVPALGAFVLNSTNYPSVDNVRFRAFATGSGYPSPASASVGAFNLASSTPHLPPVGLLLTRNGTIADLKATAGLTAPPAGVTLHLQSSTSPSDESSWTDLADGNSGLMTRSTNPTYPDLYLLLANKLPASGGIYYRAVARFSPGSLPSISNVTGPYVLTNDTPPVVTLQRPTGLSGSGTQADPLIVPAGQIKFSADATPDSQRAASKIVSLKLEIDGRIITDNPGAPAAVDYRYTAIGDHVLEAVATDDLGASGRIGTGAVYIRVIPSGSTAKAERASGSGAAAASSSGNVFTAVVSNSLGLWNDPNTWADAQGNHGVPGPNDFAIITNNAEVLISQPVEVKSLTLQGQLQNYNAGGADVDLKVNGTLAINYGQFFGLHIIIAAGAQCQAITGINSYSGTIDNYGTFALHGPAGFGGLHSFRNYGTCNFLFPISTPPDAAVNPAAGIRLLPIDFNSGVILGQNFNSLISQDGAGIVSHDSGGVISNDGGSLVASGGGNIVSHDSGGIVSHDSGGIVSHDSGGLISQDGGGIVSHDSGGLVASGGGNFIGTVGGASGANATSSTGSSIKAATAPSGFTQTGGNTNMSAVTIVGPVTLNGGVLSGSGIIQGDLTNNSGYITPGLIAVTGNFAQGANGTLVLEAAGALPSQFDQLSIGGTASLGGNLDVKLTNGYAPDVADTFNPLAYSSVTGSFAGISVNSQVSFNANGAVASVNPAVPSPRAGQPLNIATRLQIQGGDNLLIGGFIITGPAGSTKKVLIRGLGPTLTKFGVPGALPDPLLELHDAAGGLLTSNDNWQSNDVSQIPEAYRTNIDPLDSIVVATLTVGSNGSSNYTAVLKGAHGELGVGLAEVYDLEPTGVAQLANIATRGFVQTGDNVMIGGFIIGGSEPAKVLVRVTGPTLKNYGITTDLEDPTLELHDSNGGVISNDNWRETQEGEIVATTLQPVDEREPAILATLVPGNYTAVVRGKDETIGIAVVEAYTVK